MVFVSFPIASYAETTTTVETTVEYDRMFKEVMDYVRGTYIKGDELTEQQLFEAAMKGMFGELDVYSEFMTPAEGAEFTESLNATYVGIGVQLTTVGEYIGISKVFKGSPALAAGVKKGDYFVSVDGVSVKGFSTEELLKLVLGEEGTTVKITFGRGGTTYAVDIIRTLIKIPTVETLKISDLYKGLKAEDENQIAYISLSSFSQKTDIEFKDAIGVAQSTGAKYLILDMRNNGGGYVSTAVNIAQSIVPEGPIVRFVDASGAEVVHSSTAKSVPFEIVVLVNEYSASATEFVTAAIQDSKAGTVVGETTYGKGVAQYFAGYEQGYIIKLTMEEFFSRNNNKINEVGVKPDYFIEIPDYLMGETKYYLHDEVDNVIQVEKVLNFLGYNVGTPDKKYDRKTFNAVKKFQLDHGLYGYGGCDFSTQAKLNEAMLKSIEANDPQVHKAVSLILDKIHKN
jgi:carboxyl-terminal processing protease